MVGVVASRLVPGDGVGQPAVAVDLRDRGRPCARCGPLGAARRRLPPGGAQLGRPLVGGPGRDRRATTSAPRSTCSRRSARRRPDARVVWVSSCEVYGAPAELPIAETAPVARRTRTPSPRRPASCSPASTPTPTDSTSSARARSTTPGPASGRSSSLSSLARQAAEGRLAGRSRRCAIVTGNPDTRRDFTDVRDVVRAYRLLRRRAPRAGRGVYNVSSGRSVSAAEQVAAARRAARADRRSSTRSIPRACARTR